MAMQAERGQERTTVPELENQVQKPETIVPEAVTEEEELAGKDVITVAANSRRGETEARRRT